MGDSICVDNFLQPLQQSPYKILSFRSTLNELYVLHTMFIKLNPKTIETLNNFSRDKVNC